MQEIICPYTWDCGKTIDIKQLSKYDFLQSAISKKMTFMFLDCPACNRDFQFNTVTWMATPTIPNPNIVVIKKKKTVKQLNTILEKSKVKIPLPYFDYLVSDSFVSEITIFKDQDNFTLYDLEALCEKVKVEKKSYLTIKQLEGFVDTAKEIFNTTATEKIDFLSRGLVIGYENTRILCIDSQDNSLWVFHSGDGYDVEKVDITLATILKQFM